MAKKCWSNYCEDKDIKQSLFIVNVSPPADAKNSKVDGSGLKKGKVDQPNIFTIIP